MRNKRSKLRTKDEVRVAKATLDRLDTICKSSTSVAEIRFAIMLMKAELKETASLIEINEIKAKQEHFNWWVENYMSCRNAPCHTCHHLYNGCYEPTEEMVEEIKNRWINSHE